MVYRSSDFDQCCLIVTFYNINVNRPYRHLPLLRDKPCGDSKVDFKLIRLCLIASISQLHG